MGWILGYRQQYYNWENDYVDNSSVSYISQEGYNPEAVYDNLGCRYFILCINDFNKNYSNTLFTQETKLRSHYLFSTTVHFTKIGVKWFPTKWNPLPLIQIRTQRPLYCQMLLSCRTDIIKKY